MKNYTVTSLTVILFSFFIINPVYASDNPGGIKLTKSGTNYIVSFQLPSYDLTAANVEGTDYMHLTVNGYGVTPEAGYPALPLISFNLFISGDETNPAAIDMQIKKTTRIPESKLYPAQAPWSKSLNLDDRPFTINRDYYNTTGTESPFVTISEPFIIGGVKGVRVTIKPFSYNPAENKLTVVTEGKFTIKLNTQSRTNIHHSSSYNDYLNSVFVNYEPADASPTGNYLIITAPEYESGMAQFVSHKASLGYNVFMANTSVTGNTSADIKNYIQQRYNYLPTRPEYVLLVGDIDKIPEWVGGGLDNPHTDLYYSLLEGNDLYADVFLGRFSVSNTTELSNIITKTVFMETNINTLPKKGIFMASTDYYTITEGTQNYVIDSFFSPSGYAYQKLYVHTYGATTQQLIAALNDNQSFAIYTGHGAVSGWTDGPWLDQPQVNILMNTVYPFVYSFACLTGQFESSVCFGETWIRTIHGGSVFWGSTVSSFWDEDDILERKVVKAMFSDGLIKSAPMFWRGKVYLIQYYGSITPTVRRYLEMYNCLGDPSIYESIYGPSIVHTQLPNTENVNGPYTVNCSIIPFNSPVDPSRTKVLWTRGTSFTDSVQLINSGGNNWTANIPGNGSQSVYRYFIKTSDMLNRSSVLPLGAPGVFFTFAAMPDTSKPVIVHTPITGCPRNSWPASVTSVVTDNIGIDSVWVKWYKNNPSTGIKQFRLNNISSSNYAALFNSDTSQVNFNDSIFYRLYARDNSSHHNIDSTALYHFNIIPVSFVCIGSGTVPVPHPFNTAWKSTRTDMLYSASDINGGGGFAGDITGIGFNVVSASPLPMDGFTVKMQNTSLTSVNGFTGTGWTTVFSGTYTIPGPGMQFINLQNPFHWNGTQNLLIEICYANSTSATTTTINSTIVPNTTWSQRQDNTLGCGLTGGSPMTGRPNICLQMNTLTGISSNPGVPSSFALYQNYPNPFNPVTKIKFDVPTPLNPPFAKGGTAKPGGLVNLAIYDILGREVAVLVNQELPPGTYQVTWDGSNYPSGVYFYKLIARDVSSPQANPLSITKKMVLIK